MLNSRYAPVVALAVLGIVLVAMLGWFLGVSPQLDDASSFRAQEAEIRANIDTVEASSARLDEYGRALEADTTVADAIALNAPSRLDMTAFRDRLDAALVGSNLEFVSLETGDGVAVTAWEADPATLVSGAVARLFAQGPVATSSDANSPQSTWAPAVTAPGGDASVSGDIRMVSFDLRVVGTAEETYAFLSVMQDPATQLFQVSDVNMESRPSGASSINGVADPDDGDVITTITAALYLHNVDSSVNDEETVGSETPISDAFAPIGDVPEQPGG